MQRIRDFLGSGGGKVAGIAVAVVGVLVLFWAARSAFRDPGEELSRDRTFICSKTGKSFSYTLKAGDEIPVRSPHSNENTGYQAEMCYWTADGSIKETPTPVLLEEALGRPGPTFCPDCGRLVVGHNPRPEPGDTPPPKNNEFKPTRRTERY